ncbi:MAG: aromatic amino acid transport family protein [Chlamydiota bacterium]|nr:aromatic amino acid transport family protein [Chlamydiota bacterium]
MRNKKWGGALLISGTMIGGGMLAIPQVTSPLGFFPASILSIAVWAFMYLTGRCLVEVALEQPLGDTLFSYSRRFLGKTVQVVTACLFLFLYESLLVGYFAGGGGTLMAWGVPARWAWLLFSLPFVFVVSWKVGYADRMNRFLSIVMAGSLTIFFVSGISELVPNRLTRLAWSPLTPALSILFVAFGYHNIIPTVVTYLKREREAVQWSLLWGTLFPLVIYWGWQGLVMGMDSLTGKVRGLLFLFEYAAIATSLIGVALSVVSFLADGLGWREQSKRRWVALFSLTPPLLMGGFSPSLFAKALQVAGGIGESLINGLLPVALFYVFIKKKEGIKKHWLTHPFLLLILSAFSLVILFCEVLDLIV